MMRRGMILKLNNDYALIVTDDSHFIKIRLRDGMRIGQKIFVLDEDILSIEKDKKRSRLKDYLKVAAVLAACIAIAVIINNSFIKESHQLYAMVSLDINPSIELGVDEGYNVVEINAMNEDGKGILDLELIGKPLSFAVSKILSDVEESGYAMVSDNVVLVSTVNFKNDDDETLQKVITDGVRLAVSESTVYESTVVILIEADEEDLKAAEEEKLSVGKYRLLEMSDNKVDKKTIEEGRVSDIIKEEEIKDDLETDVTIQIINGEDLQKLNKIEEDIEHLKDKVKQIKDSLDSNDSEKIEGLLDEIGMMDNRLINDDSEFEEIGEIIKELSQIIELEEDGDSEDEELDRSYKEDEALIEEEEDIEEESMEEEEEEDIDEEEEDIDEEEEDIDEEEYIEEEPLEEEEEPLEEEEEYIEEEYIEEEPLEEEEEYIEEEPLEEEEEYIEEEPLEEEEEYIEEEPLEEEEKYIEEKPLEEEEEYIEEEEPLEEEEEYIEEEPLEEEEEYIDEEESLEEEGQ